MTNQSIDSIHDAAGNDLVFAVHRIIALSTVLRNSTMQYAVMPEVCRIPDKCFYHSNTLPPGEISSVTDILFNLADTWS